MDTGVGTRILGSWRVATSYGTSGDLWAVAYCAGSWLAGRWFPGCCFVGGWLFGSCFLDGEWFDDDRCGRHRLQRLWWAKSSGPILCSRSTCCCWTSRCPTWLRTCRPSSFGSPSRTCSCCPRLALSTASSCRTSPWLACWTSWTLWDVSGVRSFCPRLGSSWTVASFIFKWRPLDMECWTWNVGTPWLWTNAFACNNCFSWTWLGN